MDPRIEVALSLIERGCCGHLLVKGIAAEVALSRSRLQHLLQSETGTSFRDYLTEARMRTAAALLRRPELSVKEVAYSLGYTSPSVFTG